MQAQPIHSALSPAGSDRSSLALIPATGISARASGQAPRTRCSPAQLLPDSTLGWHAMLRLDDSRVIARWAVDRRLISRTLFRFGMAVDLLAFRVADTHIHALVVCSRANAGRFARSVASSLRQQLHLSVGFQAHFRAVRDQRHLYNAFRYVLRQEARHGVCLDPTHDGSSLPDLLGMRRFAPEILPRVRILLPRLQSAELHDILGVDLRAGPDANTLGPAPDHPALELLPESATAAACAASFTERGAISSAARVASVHIAQAAGLSDRQVRELLQLDARTVRRLGPRPVDDAMARAVLLQMRLRVGLRQQRGALLEVAAG